MSGAQWVLWGVGGAGLLWLLSRNEDIIPQSLTDAVDSGVDTVQAAVAGWKSVRAAPQWVPVINAAESQAGIAPDLLARMAYQESHYRPDIIDGSTASARGALGILQLMPAYFASVRVPRPFSAQDTAAQIQEAAAELARLYRHYQDWGLAVAAYNDGQGNVDRYVAGQRALPAETLAYVSDVLSDVPVGSAAMAV